MLQKFKQTPAFFVMTVTVENTVSIVLSLVFSAIIGTISPSSLASIGMISTIQNTLLGVMTFLAAGAPTLVARFVGEKNREQAKLAAEQSVALALYVSIAVTILCEFTAEPMMRLLLPGVEESTFVESLHYYRIVIISFPMWMIFNTLSVVMRAAGEAKSAFVNTALIYAVLILSAWIMVDRLQMGVTGAGLSLLICRIPGAIWMLYALIHYRQEFRVDPKRLLCVDRKMAVHIAKVGIPTMLETLGMQVALLIANSMAMDLGTHGAAVFQVVTTLTSFATIPTAIGTTCAITFVGQKLGALDYEGAKRSQRRVCIACTSVGALCGLFLATLGTGLIWIYTKDSAVQQESARLMWLMIIYDIASITVNVNDPVLRTAGDMKFVMWYTLLCVWLIQLPLTWLFCFAMDLGATGVMLANTIHLVLRSICGFVRIKKGKWIYLKV